MPLPSTAALSRSEAGFVPVSTDQIRIPKAAELVADTLRRRIIRGEYEPGKLLPAESALMASFDVARTTVRDAVRILESEGLLVVRRGANGGGRVQVPAVAMVADHAALVLQSRSTSLEDVHAARAMIETPIAGMLASRCDDAAMIASLREALDAEAASLDDPLKLSRAEGRFHQRLVQLAGSVTIELLSAVTNRIIAQQVERDVTERAAASEVLRHHREAHRAHQRLVDLIAVGAAREAEALWRRHLEAGLEHLRGSPEAPTNVLDILA
jgi:DNA-binding FadR family transcriptional regulator